MKRCLYCYELLSESEIDFHSSCSKKFFGTPLPPVMQYAEKDLDSLAKEVIHSRTALTGVQSKLSLHISAVGSDTTQKRFTIVGLWGGYILKPPSPHFPELPEVEDLTMHLAKAVKIKTAPHSLIRLSSGNLAYITKRIDRIKKSKLAMEDMCQLTERLTEHKYQGSHEQIAKTLLKYSATPGLDVINFFELVLFSFLTGNADMHLKNFSLLEQPGLGMVMSPAYDLVNTALVNSDDEEGLALTLNGRKNKIKRQDFTVAMSALKIDEKQQDNIFNKMTHAMPTWIQLIEKSFLSSDYKRKYAEILKERMDRVKR
jgi:serine/threonine-protein kinase HipA